MTVQLFSKNAIFLGVKYSVISSYNVKYFLLKTNKMALDLVPPENCAQKVGKLSTKMGKLRWIFFTQNVLLIQENNVLLQKLCRYTFVKIDCAVQLCSFLVGVGLTWSWLNNSLVNKLVSKLLWSYAVSMKTFLLFKPKHPKVRHMLKTLFVL